MDLKLYYYKKTYRRPDHVVKRPMRKRDYDDLLAVVQLDGRDP